MVSPTASRRRTVQQGGNRNGNKIRSSTSRSKQPVESKPTSSRRRINGPPKSASRLLICSILALIVLCWGLIAYMLLRRNLASGSRLRSQRGTQQPFDDLFSLPCPTARSMEAQGNAIPDSVSILHAIITPLWMGPHTSSPLHNQTLRHYRNTWARARLQMMETFAAPTLRNQTNPNFVWIILIDDSILQESNIIMQDLFNLLQEHNNHGSRLSDTTMNGGAYLLLQASTTRASSLSSLSNTFGVSRRLALLDIATAYQQGSLQLSIGNQNAWDSIMEKVLPRATPSWTAKQTENAPTTKPQLLMETMLYVDSGLHRQGVEWTQIIAARYAAKLQQASNEVSYLRKILWSPKTTSSWYQCGSSLLELHNPDVVFLKQNVYEEQGITVGRVGQRVVTRGCPSAGLTLVTMIQPSQSLAAIENAKIPQDLPLCQSLSETTTDCLLRVPYPMPIMGTGRSLATDFIQDTSVAHLKNMKPSKGMDGTLTINGTELMWGLLNEHFGMDRYDVWRASVYQYEHAEAILRGHPCAIGTNMAAVTESPACSQAITQSISEISKFVHLRRTTTSFAASRMAALRQAKLAQVQQQRARGIQVLPNTTGINNQTLII
jgi:Putative rhamnosyl transferase